MNRNRLRGPRPSIFESLSLRSQKEETEMSKRTFLRKSAITLAATLSLGGPAVYSADIVLNNTTHNVGTRTILANNALHGAYYDPSANPPQASFDSVSALR